MLCYFLNHFYLATFVRFHQNITKWSQILVSFRFWYLVLLNSLDSRDLMFANLGISLLAAHSMWNVKPYTHSDLFLYKWMALMCHLTVQLKRTRDVPDIRPFFTIRHRNRTVAWNSRIILPDSVNILHRAPEVVAHPRISCGPTINPPSVPRVATPRWWWRKFKTKLIEWKVCSHTPRGQTTDHRHGHCDLLGLLWCYLQHSQRYEGYF